MAKKKSKGLERQDAFINSLKNEAFDFGLVYTQAFLKGIRDIGYKGTHTALFESIDNAIQAEASNIYLIFDPEDGKKEPDKIAIVDDGHGMSPEMLRVAVLWGGSDRLNDRIGMGKYGYGLPSSCVSIGQSFTVISKREDSPDWSGVNIDIEKIANRSEEYIDPESKRIMAPYAKKTDLPEFVQSYFESKKISLQHGTVVLIEKIDRLSYKRFSDLKEFLIRETGIYYRNYLQSVNIAIAGTTVEPIDPLFITEGFRYYDEDEDRAIALPPMTIPFKDLGNIKARFSYMPPTFTRKPDKKHKSGQSKKDMNARFHVRKENKGIIVCRAGRQIDVVTKNPWTTFVNYDIYIGIELDFPPTMDEYFSITTSKQQIGIHESLWDALQSHGIEAAIEELRGNFKKLKAEHKGKERKTDDHGKPKPTVAEQVMQESANDVDTSPESLPIHVQVEAEEELDQTSKKKAEETGVKVETIREAIEEEATILPYKIDFFYEEEGPFFRPKQIGGQVVIFINQAHRFYIDMYESPQTTPHLQSALSLLLFSIGLSELRATAERRKMYKTERQSWSIKLQTTLEKLAEHTPDPSDEEEMDEEIKFSTNAK